jgi:hypothetical protein
VNVTVVAPPQAGGAPVLLLVSTPPIPPLPDAVASHAANAVFTAVCVWQAADVVIVGQVIPGIGAVVTVTQLLFAVHGTPLNVLFVTLR